MGCSGSMSNDPYRDVLNKHGIDSVRLFIVNYCKAQFIEEIKSEIIDVVKKRLTQVKTISLSQIDLLKKQVDSKFQTSVSRLQRAYPKNIQKAENQFQTKLQQLMGYTDILRKINLYRDQCLQRLQKKIKEAQQYATNALNNVQKQTVDSIPELKKVQQMQEEQQQKFIKEAKQKNKKSIQKNISQVQKKVDEECRIDKFQQDMSRLVSKQKLKQFSTLAERTFLMGQQKVKGASDCRTC